MGYALFNRNLIWLCPSKYLVYPQFGQFNGDSDALRHDIYTILGVYMYIYIYISMYLINYICIYMHYMCIYLYIYIYSRIYLLMGSNK